MLYVYVVVFRWATDSSNEVWGVFSSMKNARMARIAIRRENNLKISSDWGWVGIEIRKINQTEEEYLIRKV